MKKSINILGLFLFTLSLFGQVPEGYCKIKKGRLVKADITDSCKINFTFFNPDKTPAKSHIKFTVNGDTIFPQISSEGTYSMQVLPGKYQFVFCGTSWYDIKTKQLLLKKDSSTNIKVFFEPKEMKMPQVRYDLGKPVLYFYPTTTIDIKVKLVFSGKISFSYPEYSSGWKFSASPEGKLNMNGNTYNYLFWEGEKELEKIQTNWEEGFIVRSDSLVPFFEKNLRALNLTSGEAADLITFWVPKMKPHENVFIHFLFDKEYDQLASLEITPKPDNLIRFFFVWTPIKSTFKTKSQTFPTYKRNGFTVVDWGGTEIKSVPVNYN